MSDEMPRVFLSYSHDSDEHARRVRAFADRLRGDGVDAVLDQYEPHPPEGWTRWMTRQLEDADVVLVVSTATYKRRAEGREEPGVGHGVNFESMLVVQKLYRAGMRNEKYVPVLLEGASDDDVIEPLQSYTSYDLSSDGGYERLLRRLTKQPRVVKPPLGETPVLAPEATTVADRIRVEVDHLPTAGDLFLGREKELRLLDEAWDDPAKNVVSVVAWGGVGKTALVKRWLGGMAADGYRGALRVFGWSFYSQGTDEDRVAAADPFIDRALAFFGDPDPATGSPRDRGLRLAELVRRRRTLLVLDGVEPLQHPPDSPLAGRVKDPALAALVKALAASNDGLCVVTTREALVEIGDLVTAEKMELEHLDAKAGAELLHKLGVQGTDQELEKTSEEYGGHALALTLLATYLRKVHDGEVRRRDQVPLAEASAKQGGHAWRVMAAYERWLGEGPELSILRLVGLFDRPADGKAVRVLREEPVIPQLNEALVGLAEGDWKWALSNLRDNGLLGPADPADPEGLDAHPLVRAYFGDRLENGRPEAWRAGHLRLYEHFKTAAPERPDTLKEMMPLYSAVVHGCRGGKHDEAFNGVYRPRIRRENEAYQLHKLGAFGADLVAVSSFFVRPWEEPAASLTDDDQAWLLNTAGFELRALGRLTEAVQPMRASLAACIAMADWKEAAIRAGNVSELSLTLGEVAQAVASAEESVELADRSGDAAQRMIKRTTLADALHQAGRGDESAASFREAEAMQAERQPEYPRLYSLRGYQYCDLLLGRLDAALPRVETRGYPRPSLRDEEAGAACPTPEPGGRDPVAQGVSPGWTGALEVIERAVETMKIAVRNNWILDIALDHLSLGRARFGLGLAASDAERRASEFAAASEHLNQAVDGLRKSGAEHRLPWGLLARAALRRVLDERTAALADLAEATEIAERGQMKLHLADAHLQWTRFHLAAGEDAEARRSLGVAKRLVEECGYGRREGEVAFLFGRLA